MSRREDGFTVIELLIAMMVLLVITLPLVSAYVLGLATYSRSEQDATNSADAQLLASWVDLDVANAETITLTDACGGSQTLFELHWDDAGTERHVAYRTAPSSRTRDLNAGPLRDLERVECATSTGPAGTPVSLARSLLSSPTVGCDGIDTCTTIRPRSLTLTMTTFATDAEHYTFGVTAIRRVRP